METQLITYNLRDRGRKYRGVDRNFNIPALVKAINSPECQERVRKRDMLGYYGHWPRIKFGLNPQEGGLDKGKSALLIPALVTTHLKAFNDGTIEHKAEFLDTDSGVVARKLYEGRVGGFSSAIDQTRPTFWGFDYVLEPNYSTNRGWALDSAAVADMTEEEVGAAIAGEQLRGALALLDSVTVMRDALSETVEHLREENEQLLSMLSAKGISQSEALDSAGIMPRTFDSSLADRMRMDAALFREAKNLPGLAEPASKEQAVLDQVTKQPFYRGLLKHLGR